MIDYEPLANSHGSQQIMLLRCAMFECASTPLSPSSRKSASTLAANPSDVSSVKLSSDLSFVPEYAPSDVPSCLSISKPSLGK